MYNANYTIFKIFLRKLENAVTSIFVIIFIIL